ncbi:hypothetical protein Lser_V15G33128 [Lactuca serriola]
MLKEFSHPNLQKLIGYCLQGKNLFLVYEFMPNGNFEYLLNRGGVARLPLVTKVKIALGIAQGIVFLNKTQYKVGSFFSGKIYESQLDRSKILLDEDFTAKLSGYDVTKLIQGCYPKETLHVRYPDIGDYYPGWSEPLELERNLSGFTVVFAELLTGISIPNEKSLQKICNECFINQHGKLSMDDIAKKCFQICNEVNSESRMLRILEKDVKQGPLTNIFWARASEKKSPQRRNFLLNPLYYYNVYSNYVDDKSNLYHDHSNYISSCLFIVIILIHSDLTR